MKFHQKWTAALLVLAMLTTVCLGGMNVFASEDEEAVDDTAPETTVTATVSGCDLSEDSLVRAKVKQYGLSMLVPKDNVITVDSDSSVFAAADYSRSYFMEQGCILYAYTQNANYCSVTVFVSDQDSIYDYYGDYAGLSEEKRQELVKDASDDSAVAEYVTINGRGFIQVTSTDSSTGDVYTQYRFTTVIDRKQYVIYIQTLNADKDDKAVLNQMIGSIKVNGEGIYLTPADRMLLVLCIILCIAVAVIFFFFYRATQFVKVGITDFARIGFDLPRSNVLNDSDQLVGSDEEDDEDDDDDDDDDEFDDDEFDDDEEDDDTDEDERIIQKK